MINGPVAAIVRLAESPLQAMLAQAKGDYQRLRKLDREGLLLRLALGLVLGQIKAACAREARDWLPTLAEAGIPERTAQRLMRFSESATVADSTEQLEDHWQAACYRVKPAESNGPGRRPWLVPTP